MNECRKSIPTLELLQESPIVACNLEFPTGQSPKAEQRDRNSLIVPRQRGNFVIYFFTNISDDPNCLRWRQNSKTRLRHPIGTLHTSYDTGYNSQPLPAMHNFLHQKITDWTKVIYQGVLTTTPLFFTMGNFFGNLVYAFGSKQRKIDDKTVVQGPSNKLVTQVEPQLISWQYPLINYLGPDLETLSYWLWQFLTSFCVISPARWPCTCRLRGIGHWVIAQSASSCANSSKLDRISQSLCRHFVSVQLPVTGFDISFKAVENKWRLCR
jgi:hypothetical protein